MPSLSVCMIVKDEEPVIGRCLASVSLFADEIILVDTGSKDRTKEIAATYTDQIFTIPWEDNFAKARNESYGKASCDYVMWIDADDVILPEDAKRLKERMRFLEDRADVIFLPYADHKKGESKVFDSYLIRDRIIRRSLQPKWENPIHEAIPIEENWRKVIFHDIPIYHEKLVVNEEGRNYRIFQKSLGEGWVLDDYSKAYYCRELNQAKEHERAIEIFYELFRSGAKDSVVHYALSYFIDSMEQLKRYSQLKETLLQYVQKYTETEMVCCQLGRCFIKENNTEEAKEWYHRALKIQIDDFDMKIHCLAWKTVVPWIQLTRICLKEKQLEKAGEYLEQAKELAGNHKMIKILQISLDHQEARSNRQY